MADPVSATPARRIRPDHLSVSDARARVLAEVVPVAVTERVAVRAALRRVLAEDIVSPIDVPGHTNSAVDGYAVAGGDLAGVGEREFKLIGTAWAGRPFAGTVARGECVQIMTGAPMPAGTDTVVAVENARAAGERIFVDTARHGAPNVRFAGEDLARGEVALTRGKRVRPAELGMLASLGQGEVCVYRRPRVAFFSTGDELRPLGEALAPGQVYDSNRYTLYGMLSELGVELLDMGVIRDRTEDVRRAFTEAAANAEAVVTSGGVSVGDADYVKQLLGALGRVSFWQVAMRPGRPFVFGHVGDAAFFGLPGNPVAVMVAFYQFVQPALRRMMGEADPAPPHTFRARTLSRLKTRVGRTEFIRGILGQDDRGELTVRSTGSQGSGILRSMSLADCFIVLPPESGGAEVGDIVDVQPFTGVF